MDRTPIYSFQTNGFIGNPTSVIVMATVGGMSAMFVSITLGGPILVSMIALLGGIMLVYSFQTGGVTYDLYEDGVQRTIISSFTKYRKGSPIVTFFDLKDIRSFKADKDLGRNMQSYEYLKLYLRKAPGEIWITDKVNHDGFIKFRDAFLELVEHRKAKQADQNVEPADLSSGSRLEIPRKSPAMPVRKKAFYETLFAKIFTLFMLFLCGGLMYYGAQYGMRESNWFKLAAVLVPGTIYMAYRVFFASQGKQN